MLNEPFAERDGRGPATAAGLRDHDRRPAGRGVGRPRRAPLPPAHAAGRRRTSRPAAWRGHSPKRRAGPSPTAPGRRRRSRTPTATRTTRSSWSSTAAAFPSAGGALLDLHGMADAPDRPDIALGYGVEDPWTRELAHQVELAAAATPSRSGAATPSASAPPASRDDDPMGPGAGRRCAAAGARRRCPRARLDGRSSAGRRRAARRDAGDRRPAARSLTPHPLVEVDYHRNMLRSATRRAQDGGAAGCRCGARSSGSRWPRRCSRSARRSARRRHRRAGDAWATFDRQLSNRLLGSGRSSAMSVTVSNDGRSSTTPPSGGGSPAAASLTETTDRYRIASISKVLTSVAVLQLVEQGRLGIDQPSAGTLAGYLGATPDRPPRRRHHRPPAAVPHRRLGDRRHADVRRRRRVVPRGRRPRPALGVARVHPGHRVRLRQPRLLPARAARRADHRAAVHRRSCRTGCSRRSASATWRSARRTAPGRPTCGTGHAPAPTTWRCCGRPGRGWPRRPTSCASSTRSTRPSRATTRCRRPRRRRCASSPGSSTSLIAGTASA